MDHLVPSLRAAAEDTRLRSSRPGGTRGPDGQRLRPCAGPEPAGNCRAISSCWSRAACQTFPRGPVHGSGGHRGRRCDAGPQFVRRPRLSRHSRIAADPAPRRPAAAPPDRRRRSSATTPSVGMSCRPCVADREIERALVIICRPARGGCSTSAPAPAACSRCWPQGRAGAGHRPIARDAGAGPASLARSGIDNADIRQGRHVRRALPVDADSFDVVTIHHVLHCADDPAAALARAARVMRPAASCWWSISRRTTWSS